MSGWVGNMYEKTLSVLQTRDYKILGKQKSSDAEFCLPKSWLRQYYCIASVLLYHIYLLLVTYIDTV